MLIMIMIVMFIGKTEYLQSLQIIFLVDLDHHVVGDGDGNGNAGDGDSNDDAGRPAHGIMYHQGDGGDGNADEILTSSSLLKLRKVSFREPRFTPD